MSTKDERLAKVLGISVATLKAARFEASKPEVKPLHTKQDLIAFAKEHGLRPDWHEPDEQGISARLIGSHLDNAMGATMRPLPQDDPTNPHGEFNIVLSKSHTYEQDEVPVDIAVVNLADLLAWAAQA